MIKNTPALVISPAFTIEDIHRIRAWNYERRKCMSRQAVIDDINSGAREFEALIEATRLLSFAEVADNLDDRAGWPKTKA